jgi:large subunit ribosomal protein L15
MELHSLKPAKGAVKKGKRIARGQGSGRGGTSTKGHKGAKSRAGHKLKRGFEGGQMPLQMRLPKVGFKNPNRVEYVPINLDYIQLMAEKHNLTDINLVSLKEHGFIARLDKVKVLGRGELKAKVNLSVHACSPAAKEAVEKVGGSIVLV